MEEKNSKNNGEEEVSDEDDDDDALKVDESKQMNFAEVEKRCPDHRWRKHGYGQEFAYSRRHSEISFES
ncbi:hypothetical protein POUND7_010554 [Theobroma cacao]